MTTPPDGLLATGLHWRNGKPALALDGGDDQPLALGDTVGWQIHGPRRCIGVWLPEINQRRPCPHSVTLPDSGPNPQCQTCTAIDPGKALARDTALDDPRTFALYLAWFGPGLLKVGLTATERGTDRLADQGALAFSWLAHGPLRPIRSAEQAVAATGLAHERIRRHAKITAYLHALHQGTPTGEDAAGELAATHAQLEAATTWSEGLQSDRCVIHDHIATFGLTPPPPAPAEEITALHAGAVLAGRLLCLIGREAILDTNPDGPTVIDTRLLAGWQLTPATGPSTGTSRHTLPTTPTDASTQGSLF